MSRGKSDRPFLWIAFDGVECSGKTSICERLVAATPGSVLLPEFSSTAVGRYLRDSVSSSPHIISRSLVGQSLLFLADYAEGAQSIDSMCDDDATVVFQDRGFLSKFVYQWLVLTEELGTNRSRSLLKAIMRELPHPDVTILLDAPMSVIEPRLASARPGWLSSERRDFVERAAVIFRIEIDDLDGVTFSVSQSSSDRVDDILARVVDFLDDEVPGWH
jgi:thymidylate kinase